MQGTTPFIKKFKTEKNYYIYDVNTNNEDKVCYQYCKDSSELERMDYMEFIARVTSHIPDKGQVTIRYHGGFMPMPTEER